MLTTTDKTAISGLDFNLLNNTFIVFEKYQTVSTIFIKLYNNPKKYFYYNEFNVIYVLN